MSASNPTEAEWFEAIAPKDRAQQLVDELWQLDTALVPTAVNGTITAAELAAHKAALLAKLTPLFAELPKLKADAAAIEAEVPGPHVP